MFYTLFISFNVNFFGNVNLFSVVTKNLFFTAHLQLLDSSDNDLSKVPKVIDYCGEILNLISIKR